MTFTAAYFPGRSRHDLEAVLAYGAYRRYRKPLLEAGIVTNRNAIPRDPNGAWYTSGVRLGTPALTTLGLGTEEHDVVADLIDTTLRATTVPTGPSKARYTMVDGVAATVRARAGELLAHFPLYPEISL